MKESYQLLAEQLSPMFDGELTPEQTVRRGLKNYRAGKGMSLTTEAYKYLENKPYYTFMKFEMNSNVDSRLLVWLDNHSTTPYYVGRTYVYLTDPLHQFSYAMGESLEDFVEYLKNI